MNNHKLLERYRKKLSIIFALFMIFSIWVLVFIFQVSIYLNMENKDKAFLRNRIGPIENILENDKLYRDIREVTFKKVVGKIFKDSVILSENKIIFNDIEDFDEDIKFSNNVFITIEDYKYYFENFTTKENIDYNIIVRKKINISRDVILENYFYFLIFSSPILILFYIIGYYFIGRNLKPIKDNIESQGDFIGNINHEFKTPLSEIISSLEISLKNKQYEKNIKQSIFSAKKIDKILSSLTGLINISNDEYKFVKFDLVEYSKEIIEEYSIFTLKQNIKILFSSKKNKIIKNLNKQHYYIVFSNILSNAIKYSNDDSKIDVILNNNGFEINDYGIGIEKKNLKNIFDRYFRENYVDDGSGVGLSLVKKIVDINKWTIKISSKKVIGSTFKINF